MNGLLSIFETLRAGGPGRGRAIRELHDWLRQRVRRPLRLPSGKHVVIEGGDGDGLGPDQEDAVHAVLWKVLERFDRGDFPQLADEPMCAQYLVTSLARCELDRFRAQARTRPDTDAVERAPSVESDPAEEGEAIALAARSALTAFERVFEAANAKRRTFLVTSLQQMKELAAGVLAMNDVLSRDEGVHAAAPHDVFVTARNRLYARHMRLRLAGFAALDDLVAEGTLTSEEGELGRFYIMQVLIRRRSPSDQSGHDRPAQQ